MNRKILNILFWSIISAAFIGPGTITTASKAGAEFGFELVWVIVFSIIACIFLQEASARLTMVSGYNLGQAITRQFSGRKSWLLVVIIIIGAIIIGGAAYQTGNILGAVAGITLIFDVSPSLFILGIGAAAAIALYFPSIRSTARFLGVLVIIMGICFITTAILLKPSFTELIKGTFVPSFPGGSGLLILGLLGTTVVPYNLFLGSGIADKRQTIKEMRFGLTIAIILGGVISMLVLIVGTAVEGEFTFQTISDALALKLGNWSRYIFAFGLFAAGFSSAITAPLAAAITAQSLFGAKKPEKWRPSSLKFRLVWLFVLLAGVCFGIMGFKPIPVIILAQALNGFILPVIGIFLLWVINNKTLLGEKYLNSRIQNILMVSVVWISVIMGLNQIVHTLQKSFPELIHRGTFDIILIFSLSLMIIIPVIIKIHKLRKTT